MGRGTGGLTRARLGLGLAVFFVALAAPAALLVVQAFDRLKWEAFHHQRVLAEDLAARIDRGFSELVWAEERRPFDEYAFLAVAPGDGGRPPRRSPLSALPVPSAIPGLIGYFQVDEGGALTTPLLPGPGQDPAAYGVGAADLAERRAREQAIRSVLSENRLVEGPGVPPARPAAPEPRPRVSDDDRSRAKEASEDGAAKTADAVRETTRRRGLVSGLRSELEEVAPAMAASEAAPREQERLGLSQAGRKAAPQAAFDELESAIGRQSAAKGLGRLDDLKLEAPYRARPTPEPEAAAAAPPLRERRLAGNEARRDAPAAADRRASAAGRAGIAPATRAPITAFVTERDPFVLSLLDSGHFVLYRRVWRAGRRYVQGALIAQEPFLADLVERPFRESLLVRATNLAVAWHGDVLRAFGGGAETRYLARAEDLSGALLHRARISAPLSAMELVFAVTRLPAGPGASVLGWTAAVLASVLLAGFVLLYRLGARQIELARQQQDFVSAVSHELRTPLTSIRMYAEMLREGWASDAKKRDYYAYIQAESERLSRLIGNVLQLSRMARRGPELRLTTVGVGTLLDEVRSKVDSQLEAAGFELRVACAPDAAARRVRVDPDAFSQIVINLVDNAVKFAHAAELRRVELGWEIGRGSARAPRVVLSVRDYGPGIPRDQRKKVFGLFYRGHSELTRETTGTGIGLALVRSLAAGMDAEVAVESAGPGARFTVSFPAAP